jgi:hypothetical protein
MYQTALDIDYSHSRTQTSKSQGFPQWCSGTDACIQKMVKNQPTIRINMNTQDTLCYVWSDDGSDFE